MDGKFIDSDFALLDIKRGRKKIAKRLEKSGPIEVLILGTIDRAWGNDDGTSIEFEMTVKSVQEVQK